MKKESIDIGNSVYCDLCGEEWTGRKESGGILFGSKAVCPNCALRVESNARQYNESHYIKDRCPEGISFADWCLQLRGGNNEITFYELDNIEELQGFRKKQ